MQNLIISTDLDGSLLDHQTYSAEPANALLEKLEQLEIPVVFNTSKTFAEVLEIRAELNNNHPFICENGSVIFIPVNHPLAYKAPNICSENEKYRFHVLGTYRSDLIKTLGLYKNNYKFKGFSDMSIDELMNLTGLSARKAVSATNRTFSEPFIWLDHGSSIDEFRHEMERHSIRLVRGGRFIHVIGSTDKGEAQTWLKNGYEGFYNQRFEVMALGDAENDLDMILESDHPAQVRSLYHDFPSLPENNNVYRTIGVGPTGWHEAVMRQLMKMDLLGG
ncbi:MAG: HAD-IIB family hydrolase [Litoricola sp.]|nr:HAD-IIB family hydrolase [Litorivicinus sp.]OUX80634.1 MAG: hypothetical protein CBC19_00865 [Oceanospirillales bacterium TMED59]